jgi:hypothetical protein
MDTSPTFSKCDYFLLYVGQKFSFQIATTGSNWAIGVLMGYRHMKSCLSTISFCLVTSSGSLVMSCNMA